MDLTMIGVPKPRKDITEFRYRKLKDILIQRKWDGCCTFGVTNNGIYSRRTSSVTGRKIPYTNKFPHIVEELNKIKLPRNSVIVGEMVWTKDGRDLPTSRENFRILQRLTGSSDSTSKKLQEKFGSPIWIIFDLLILEEEPAYLLPYKTRFDILKHTIVEKNYIKLIKNINLKVKDAFEMAKHYKWEGLVLKDPSAPTEIIENDINNAVIRPDGYWKMKPKREADVIIKGIEFSRKDKNRVASLLAFLLDSSGKYKYVGKVGTFEGFSWKYRYDLAKQKVKFNGSYFELERPFTIKVRFDSWSDKGKMLKPVFYSLSNKSEEECTIENEGGQLWL